MTVMEKPGAICVSAAAGDHIGNKLPLAFDDLGDQQVTNIAQAIRVYRVQVERPPAKPTAALRLPDKPSIAMLRFQHMSGDPAHEYFADGMVEGNYHGALLYPLAPRNCPQFELHLQRQAVDVKRVARTLRALRARRQRAQAREPVRITGQLIDAETSTHLWATVSTVRCKRRNGPYLELSAKVGDGLTGRRRRIVGEFEPPLLQQRRIQT